MLKDEVQKQTKSIQDIKSRKKPTVIELKFDNNSSDIRFEVEANQMAVFYKNSSITYTSKNGFTQEKLDEDIEDAIEYFKKTK